MTTGKTKALTRRTFVDKVMSLLFNMLSRLVITFLPRSKRLLVSWLQSLSTVILAPKNKVRHRFHYLPIYLQWSDRTGCHDLTIWILSFYSPYTLNKQGNNIQPWRTPFPIGNQSVVPCPVLTVSILAYRFLKRQLRWSGIPISFRIFHSLLWSTQSKVYSNHLE